VTRTSTTFRSTRVDSNVCSVYCRHIEQMFRSTECPGRRHNPTR